MRPNRRQNRLPDFSSTGDVGYMWDTDVTGKLVVEVSVFDDNADESVLGFSFRMHSIFEVVIEPVGSQGASEDESL